jgi:hypothetical protein
MNFITGRRHCETRLRFKKIEFLNTEILQAVLQNCALLHSEWARFATRRQQSTTDRNSWCLTLRQAITGVIWRYVQ